MDVKPTMQKHNWWSLVVQARMEDEMEEISWAVINLFMLHAIAFNHLCFWKQSYAEVAEKTNYSDAN